MIDSHIHLIPEDTREYAETLVARMKEHDISSAVLFGSQCLQACDDNAVRDAATRFGDAFIPFLSRTVDIARPDALFDCCA